MSSRYNIYYVLHSFACLNANICYLALNISQVCWECNNIAELAANCFLNSRVGGRTHNTLPTCHTPTSICRCYYLHCWFRGGTTDPLIPSSYLLHTTTRRSKDKMLHQSARVCVAYISSSEGVWVGSTTNVLWLHGLILASSMLRQATEQGSLRVYLGCKGGTFLPWTGRVKGAIILQVFDHKPKFWTDFFWMITLE